MSSVQSPSTGDIRILFWVGIAACLGGLILFTGRAGIRNPLHGRQIPARHSFRR